MNLSILLIIILILTIIPALFLSNNRIKIYIYSCLPGFIIIFFMFFICLNFSNIEYSIGKFFYPMFKFIIDRHQYLTYKEMYHISSTLFFTIIYLALYLITHFILNLFYIGANPNVTKPITILVKILLSSVFIIFTFVVFSISLIEIRMILPINDGFFSSIFQLIYKIEA